MLLWILQAFRPTLRVHGFLLGPVQLSLICASKEPCYHHLDILLCIELYATLRRDINELLYSMKAYTLRTPLSQPM